MESLIQLTILQIEMDSGEYLKLFKIQALKVGKLALNFWGGSKVCLDKGGVKISQRSYLTFIKFIGSTH